MYAGGSMCVPCCEVDKMVVTIDKLTSRTVDKVNETQELVLVNDFARETNETLFKKTLQDRISDIASWRWVLEDLSKRLDGSIGVLKYELKAIRVVLQRIKDEISERATRCSVPLPGGVCPGEDPVEAAIKEESKFLRSQKGTFEDLLCIIERRISYLEKTKDRIRNDILNKDKTLHLEESVAAISVGDYGTGRERSCKSMTSLCHWENRCFDLKRDGLKALSKALITRQKARGARVQLTLASQELASKVDLILRKRMHANHTKLLELDWQRQEAIRDLETLEEELTNTEKTLLSNMEQEKMIEARLADRSHRPNGELTRDEVDRKLKDELARIRRFIRDLKRNHVEINELQNHIKDQLVKMDCVAEDIITVLRQDEDRMQGRMGEQPTSSTSPKTPSPVQSDTRQQELDTIREEDEELNEEVNEEVDENGELDEEDGYPFAY